MEKAMDANIELTIYNQGLVLTNGKRELDLKIGIQNIEYINVAVQIDPA